MEAKPNGSDRDQASAQFADVSLEQLRGRLHDFAEERDWAQFHTPRNLMMALVGEVGELAEIFQWKGEVQRGLPTFSEEEKTHVGEELSDVLLYLTNTTAETNTTPCAHVGVAEAG
eukprot:gene12474-15681_t